MKMPARPGVGARDVADVPPARTAAPGPQGQASRRAVVTMETAPAAGMQAARRQTGDVAIPATGAMAGRGAAGTGGARLRACAPANGAHPGPVTGGLTGLPDAGRFGATPRGVVALQGPFAPAAVAGGPAAPGGGAAAVPAEGGDGTASGALAAATSPSQAVTIPAGVGQAAGGGPTEGDVYLDGTLVGRWMARTLARAAARPASGGAAFDPTRSRLPVGAMIGA
jgi:hypothetical protein